LRSASATLTLSRLSQCHAITHITIQPRYEPRPAYRLKDPLSDCW